MNSLELEFLQLLNFSLFVSPEVYSKYNAELRNYVGVVNIPVYMSPYPNSPTSAKASRGNFFVSRPPSTSPFLPLVETVRLPTPPLLDADFVPALNAQSYYHRVLESKSTAAQVPPYESHSPHLQRTFIKSSPPPCDAADGSPYTYISPSPFAPDQTSGGTSFGQFCVVPMCGQFYEKGEQVTWYSIRSTLSYLPPCAALILPLPSLPISRSPRSSPLRIHQTILPQRPYSLLYKDFTAK